MIPAGFELLRPELLATALVALAVLAAGLLGLRARARAAARLCHERHRRRMLGGLSVNRARLRLGLAALATALLGVALAGPVRGWTEREVRRRALDIVVCIDTSRSMLVRDLRPSRLERARREVRGLLDRLRGDRVALLCFSGDVREVAPLTHDRVTLAAFLDSVDPADNRLGGTDVGAALEAALELFDGRTGAHEAIVLLTDGEDLGHRGREVAAAAAERGIRVYVVGMASRAGGKIPETRPDGSEAFVRDRDGNEVVSRLDEEALRAIAATTGGEYLGADRSPTPLEELYDERIALLEGRELGQRLRRVPHDRFQWFLVLALVCMVGESALRERRRGGAA